MSDTRARRAAYLAPIDVPTPVAAAARLPRRITRGRVVVAGEHADGLRRAVPQRNAFTEFTRAVAPQRERVSLPGFLPGGPVRVDVTIPGAPPTPEETLGLELRFLGGTDDVAAGCLPPGGLGAGSGGFVRGM